LNILLVTEDAAIQRRLEAVIGGKQAEQITRCSDAVIAERRILEDPTFSMLVIDFGLASLGGLKPVERLSRLLPNCPTVLLIPTTVEDIGRQALKVGITAVVPSNIPAAKLSNVFKLVDRDYELLIQPRKTQNEGSRKSQTLSRREMQIVSLLCEGQQNKEIAHAFGIKEVTVKMHMRSIIRKLGARNRTHAALIARDRGLA